LESKFASANQISSKSDDPQLRYTDEFLPRDAMRKRGLCWFPVSVRPSIRHVGVLYPDGWRHRQASLSAR